MVQESKLWYDYIVMVRSGNADHRGSVSNAIDAFEPSIEGETPTVLREIRQSYPPA